MRSKRAIALVITRPPDTGADGKGVEWLLVRRPPNDEELPGVWGLPAGSLRSGEDEADLIARIGRDKLGVTTRQGSLLIEGSVARPRYRLAMKLYGARIVSGVPAVPQSAPGVTQYASWAWRPPTDLSDGAASGSLCCALGLRLLQLD